MSVASQSQLDAILDDLQKVDPRERMRRIMIHVVEEIKQIEVDLGLFKKKIDLMEHMATMISRLNEMPDKQIQEIDEFVRKQYVIK